MPPRATIAMIAPVAAMFCCALAHDAPKPVGEWHGSYTCAQGETALHLAIKQAVAGGLSAVFSFSSLPSNPGVPKGSFEMAGTFDRSTGHLKLSPATWLTHPPGFVTVGLDGKLECSGSRLAGKVTGGFACRSFALDRDGSQPGVTCGSKSAKPALVASR